jgi:hypothetical protein
VGDVFLAPNRLARRLGDDPPWLDAVLGVTLLAALTVALLPDAVFLEQMEEAVTRRGEPVEITSPPEEIARWGRYLGMMAMVATQPAFVFIVAGILVLVFGVLGGGRTNFRNYLALAAHAAFIPVLGTLVEVLARRISPDPTIAPFGLPVDAGPGSSAVILALDGIDPFFVWMLAVLAVGVATFEDRRSPVTTMVILLGIYGAFLLAGAAFVP